MSKRIAINGFGRIGRIAFRKMFEDSDFEIVAINSMSGSETAAHLLKYDSAHGPYKIDSIKFDENNIYVDDKVIKVVTAREASEAPWKELNIDIVLECSGLYTSDEKAMAHIEAGAKRVVISTLREASKLCLAFIEKWNLGGGNWTGGEVQIDGKPQYQVGYNGRVWIYNHNWTIETPEITGDDLDKELE